MDKILKYLGNIIGYLIIFTGIVIFKEYGLLPSILLILSGIVITTHFLKIKEKFKFNINRKYRIILSIVLFIIAALISPTPTDNSNSNINKNTNLNSKESIKETTQKDAEKQSNLKVHFIDTGNSDCTFVETDDKNLLIDAGDNNDEQRIVNYLNNINISKIDYLVSTHPDADHSGGLDAVVTNFDIGQSYVSNGSSDSKTYRDFIYSLSSKGLTPSVPLENQAINLDNNTTIKFFNTESTGEGNELSLVTLLESNQTNILFMGDATEKIEKNIVNQLPTDIDILKVSHHGSKSATSDKFLKSLNIKYAVIECGKNNKYNHPDKEVLERLEDKNIKTFRTDIKGNITFSLKNNKLSYKFTETTSNNGSAPVTKDPSDEIKKQQEEAARQAQIAAEQEAQRQAQIAAEQEARRQAEIEAQRQAQIQQQQQNETTVYIAGSGDGTKYHSNPNCSNMKNPVAISISEAQSRGYGACKKCY